MHEKVYGIHFKGIQMLRTVLIIILILMLLGSVPVWSHSANWGYGPSGISTVLLIVVLFFLFGRG